MDRNGSQHMSNGVDGGTSPFVFQIGDDVDNPIDLEGNFLPDRVGEEAAEVVMESDNSESTIDFDDEDSAGVPTEQVFQPSSTYNVNDSVELHDGTFLNIRRISRAGVLNGIKLIRTTSERISHGFTGYTNELVWVVESTWNEYHNRHPPGLIRVSPQTVKRKRKIIFTNRILTREDRIRERRNFESVKEQEEEGKLFCRWQFMQILWYNSPIEYAFVRLKEEDVRVGPWRVSDQSIRQIWRGQADVPGGSHCIDPSQDVQIVQVDVTGSGTVVTDLGNLHNERRYTLGDVFCGGGGMGQGAKLAGLHLQWAVDKDGAAASTYEENFKGLGTMVFQQDIFDFIDMARRGGFQIDILHLSPSCQFFSPAHTHSGRNDEINSAALFCLEELLKALRPRQVTMEQTTGLLQTHKHKPYFDAVIDSFVSHGYSVRWSILHCREYGVPQIRRRLVIIAAGPGEKLPNFPEPKYGPLSKFERSFNTIGSAIVGIPDGAIHHDIQRSYFPTGPKPEYSPDTQAYTLTCNGGESYHPDGLRTFTPREMACLQTFPLHHTFHAEDGSLARVSAAKTMIGNAVPPVLAKYLFREVKKALEEVDGIPSKQNS